MDEKQKRFLESNLQLSNRMISQELGKTEAQIRNFLNRNNIKRTNEQLEQIRLRIGANQTGEKNPNWRGGISQDNYRYKKIQVVRYPVKVNARQKVYCAKKKGELVPKPCTVCSKFESIQAHHPDYESPLSVIWLCRKHHRELHQNELKHSGTVFETDLSQRLKSLKQK